MNNILSLITEIEYRIDKFLPDLFGGSLIVVGEKE